jgi:hypothetical protein
MSRASVLDPDPSNEAISGQPCGDVADSGMRTGACRRTYGMFCSWTGLRSNHTLSQKIHRSLQASDRTASSSTSRRVCFPVHRPRIAGERRPVIGQMVRDETLLRRLGNRDQAHPSRSPTGIRKDNSCPVRTFLSICRIVSHVTGDCSLFIKPWIM